jgi:carbon storage regulator
MLVLTRKLGEKVFIGHAITITVVKVARNKVRVGIDAPDQVHIVRGELACWQDEPAACDEPADSAFTREGTDEALAGLL